MNQSQTQTKANINEYLVQITGKASLPTQLSLSHSYKLKIEADCYKIELADKQDGTIDQIHKLKLLTGEVETDGGVVKLKDKRKMSQKLRNCIWTYRNEKFPDYDEEEFYEKAMKKIIAHLDSVLDR